MTQHTRRLFLSDVHLGGDEAKSWFQTTHHRAPLLTFFSYLSAQRDVKDLVLLGDFFDTWQWPMNVTPTSLPEVIRARHEPVIDAVRAARGAVENIFYVNGNHDMDVTQKELDAIFGKDSTGKGIVTWIPEYRTGRLLAEHGSRFAMFNAQDRMHDPKDGLPLGYFITRLLSSGNVSYDTPGAVLGYVDDLLEAAFTTQTLAESVIEALAERVGVASDATFRMPGGRPNLTVAQVQRKYAPLFTRWTEKFGHRYAMRAIAGEAGGLGWFADRLCERHGYKVVVLGHTHDHAIDEDKYFLAGGRVYANTGFWCPAVVDGRVRERATFVDVDKRDSTYAVSVRACTDEVTELRRHVV